MAADIIKLDTATVNDYVSGAIRTGFESVKKVQRLPASVLFTKDPPSEKTLLQQLSTTGRTGRLEFDLEKLID